jgi:hypothetical protein
MVAVPAEGILKDDTFYERATEFDGFRFSKLREEFGEDAKFDSIDTSVEYLAFGLRPHVW